MSESTHFTNPGRLETLKVLRAIWKPIPKFFSERPYFERSLNTGIGVRVLGDLNPEHIRKVQESDQILFEELKEHRLYNSTWQAFTVLIPVKTVGVKGDGRVYEEVIALRMVNSQDGMTASVTEMPWSFLNKVSSRICNEVKGITRVVYDITSKPPGTIEWE